LTFEDILSTFELIINELIREIMKKIKLFTGSFLFTFILLFLVVAPYALGQQTAVSSPPIPDEVNKIFMHNCTPCHVTKGRVLALQFVNFDNWTKYSPEKQSSKAGMIYYEVNKGNMPPKAARENRPDIIPTKEQLAIIKKWADSLKTEKK
jgi:hypothetical protein